MLVTTEQLEHSDAAAEGVTCPKAGQSVGAAKAEHMHAFSPTNSTPRYIPNGNAYVCAPKPHGRNAHGSSAHHSAEP